MYIYGERARIEGDEQHNKVVDSLTEMEAMRNPVTLGFVIYWAIWICLAVGAGWYFLG